MPLPMDIMMFVTNRLIKEEMNKRKCTYEEHKEIERCFNDFYDSVMLQGKRVPYLQPKKEQKKVASI